MDCELAWPGGVHVVEERKEKKVVAGRQLETKDKGVCHRLVLSHARRGHAQGLGRSVSILLAPVSLFPKHDHQWRVCASDTPQGRKRRNSSAFGYALDLYCIH